MWFDWLLGILILNWKIESSFFPSEVLSLFADSTPRRNAPRRHLSRNTLIRLLINRTERRRQRRISRGHLSSSTEVHFSNLKITNQRKFETKFAKNRHFRRDTGWINNPRNESLPQHTQTDENNPKCVHKLKGVATSLSLSLSVRRLNKQTQNCISKEEMCWRPPSLNEALDGCTWLSTFMRRPRPGTGTQVHRHHPRRRRRFMKVLWCSWRHGGKWRTWWRRRLLDEPKPKRNATDMTSLRAHSVCVV